MTRAARLLAFAAGILLPLPFALAPLPPAFGNGLVEALLTLALLGPLAILLLRAPLASSRLAAARPIASGLRAAPTAVLGSLLLSLPGTARHLLYAGVESGPVYLAFHAGALLAFGAVLAFAWRDPWDRRGDALLVVAFLAFVLFAEVLLVLALVAAEAGAVLVLFAEETSPRTLRRAAGAILLGAVGLAAVAATAGYVPGPGRIILDGRQSGLLLAGLVLLVLVVPSAILLSRKTSVRAP